MKNAKGKSQNGQPKPNSLGQWLKFERWKIDEAKRITGVYKSGGTLVVSDLKFIRAFNRHNQADRSLRRMFEAYERSNG